MKKPRRKFGAFINQYSILENLQFWRVLYIFIYETMSLGRETIPQTFLFVWIVRCSHTRVGLAYVAALFVSKQHKLLLAIIFLLNHPLQFIYNFDIWYDSHIILIPRCTCIHKVKQAVTTTVTQTKRHGQEAQSCM